MLQILCLSSSGSPSKWLHPEDAALLVAKGRVGWDLGETCMTLHGGINAESGSQSLLELKPIISVAGIVHAGHSHKHPPFSRKVLLRRDRLTCAYCGDVRKEQDLTLDHVTPQSRGGNGSWMNLVAACKPCNNRKDCKTPEEARMPLLYVPYTPNLHETFILDNRVILADQHEFLLQSVPKSSRLWS